jgi:hypothetical protein
MPRQPREAADCHANREVLTLDIAGADVARVGASVAYLDYRFYHRIFRTLPQFRRNEDRFGRSIVSHLYFTAFIDRGHSIEAHSRRRRQFPINILFESRGCNRRAQNVLAGPNVTLDFPSTNRNAGHSPETKGTPITFASDANHRQSGEAELG